MTSEIRLNEHVWTLSSKCMSEPSIRSFMQFLSMANNAHTIDITMRADAKNYSFQADFLKYMKWVPVYRNDVSGELEDVAYSHLAKTIAYDKECSIKLTIALEILERAESDYLGLATIASKNGLKATAKDALETAEYIKTFLRG